MYIYIYYIHKKNKYQNDMRIILRRLSQDMFHSYPHELPSILTNHRTGTMSDFPSHKPPLTAGISPWSLPGRHQVSGRTLLLLRSRLDASAAPFGGDGFDVWLQGSGVNGSYIQVSYYRGGERDREREREICLHIYIYIYCNICIYI